MLSLLFMRPFHEIDGTNRILRLSQNMVFFSNDCKLTDLGHIVIRIPSHNLKNETYRLIFFKK